MAEHDLTAATVARESYGRLLALLAAPTGDIASAEDALADAFESALTTWPTRGVPDNPEGWLLTVARNRLRDLYRSSAHRTSVPLDETSSR
ncbi:MAG: DNA-directed polymerase sigma-70 factor, partial [Frondihabitans sp.]|nr:DNA-directed polymerase sigma-70 factor [Frondihabitans sp.]